MLQFFLSSLLLLTVFVSTLAGLAQIEPVHGDVQAGVGDLPNFQKYSDPQRRKAKFLDYLRPIVTAENGKIAHQRKQLKRLVGDLSRGRRLSHERRRWLEQMADYYDVDTDERRPQAVGKELLRKVDVVPVPLVLVQAAKESAWGRSRFARNGNNLFGQHCFSAGCGIVPKDREPGKRVQVQTFPTVRAAVKSYLHNLNSHPKYQKLRAIRARLREKGKPVTSVALAAGLNFYSERRQDYISEVRSMIRNNDLTKADAAN